MLTESAKDGSFATVKYEEWKCDFLDTFEHCLEQGITFVPLCVEASSGSWGPQARKFFKEVAKISARFSGDLVSARLDLCMQTLSVALHRANARSILTRPFHTPQPVHAPAVFARATLTAAQAQQAAHSQSISEQMAF